VCQLDQLAGVGDGALDLLEVLDYPNQAGAVLAQLLRPLRVVPDIGLLELAVYLLELFLLAVEVKDTP